ncbi:MAG: HAD-IB family hydrolase [Caulobacter sp.]|nr:HAD-IB family hydrolase [Caulobacter sp.]
MRGLPHAAREPSRKRRTAGAAGATGLADRRKAKETLIGALLKGWSEERVSERAHAFPIGRLVNPRAVERIRRHHAEGHRVVVVTASPELFVRPWAAGLGIDSVIGTRLEVADGVLTGRFAGANCHGPEKVARLAAFLGRVDGLTFHAYGDSSGDRELLALAESPGFRSFHGRHHRIAGLTAFLRALA